MPPLFPLAFAYFDELGWPAVPNQAAGIIQSVYATEISEMNLYLHVSEERRQFIFYNTFPEHAPPDVMPAVHEFITRVNFELQFGVFQFHLGHGGLRFTTSLTLGDASFDVKLLHPLLMGNVVSMFRFTPALKGLISKEKTLKEALEMSGMAAA